MIQLQNLKLHGTCDEGSFSGSIAFESGINVITGSNGFGKSLMVSGIAWCLGLERLVTSVANDNSIFSEAVRSQIELNGKKGIRVRESTAELTLGDGKGLELRLSRPILGDEQRFISATIRGPEGTAVESKLIAGGRGVMADETAGFQAHLFKLLGWPICDTVKFNGEASPLYWENLAPLFMVEQLGGWTDIQAQQIRKYGIIEIDQYVTEYVLGLDVFYKSRFQRHTFSTRERELRQELGVIVGKVNSIVEASGNPAKLSIRQTSTDELVRRFAEFKVAVHLKEQINWDYRHEVERLKAQLEVFEKEVLSEGDSGRLPDGFREISSDLIIARNQFQEVEEDLNRLLRTLVEQQAVQQDLKHKLRSSSDLLRFKKSGVGLFLDHQECPTCRQSIDVHKFALTDLSSDGLQAYKDATEKEVKALESSIATMRAQAHAFQVRKSELLDKVSTLNDRLGFLRSTVNQRKAEFIELLNKRNDLRQRIDNENRMKSEVDSIQRDLNDCVARISGFLTAKSSPADLQVDNDKLGHFAKKYRELLSLVDLSTFVENKALIKHVEIDRDSYLPTFNGKLLRNFASASDQARIILPYLMALQFAAIEKSGRHPGFSVMDEPIQQNPDKERRPALIEFIKELPARVPGQVIIFTSLFDQEVEALRKSKVNLKQLVGNRFLQPAMSS